MVKNLMKNILKRTILLAALSFALSALLSCSQTATTEKVQIDKKDAPAVTKDSPAINQNDFPPAPAAVAQADIKVIDGTTFKVEDKKGKVILLNLWATWCGPCREEMPELIALQNKYRDKDFEIIGLNTDDEEIGKINDFAADMKLNYTIAWADAKLMKELVTISKFPGIPQSYLIDRNGRMRGIFTGAGAKVVNQLKETTEKVVNE